MKEAKFATLQRQLSKKVRKLRERLGVSQEKLSFQAGLDRTYISRVERSQRNPTLLTLAKMAEALQVEVKDLFDF